MEFAKEYLYRVTVRTEYGMSPTTPIYVIATDKDRAREYVSRHMRSGYLISSIANLGDRIAGNMFHKGRKK